MLFNLLQYEHPSFKQTLIQTHKISLTLILFQTDRGGGDAQLEIVLELLPSEKTM